MHAINVNNALVGEMLLWVRSIRVFKCRDRKSVHQEIRTIPHARVNYKETLKD